jgi:copper(I)-binding protein
MVFAKTAASLLFAALLSGVALAENAVTVSDASVRLVPPVAENTGIFMTLRNGSDKDIKLVGAASDAAKKVELHTVIEEGGMKKMRPVPFIAIKAKGETVLKPGDYHVMLLGLNKPLQEGEEVAFSLRFDDGSEQSLKAPVRKIQMPAAPAGAMPAK